LPFGPTSPTLPVSPFGPISPTEPSAPAEPCEYHKSRRKNGHISVLGFKIQTQKQKCLERGNYRITLGGHNGNRRVAATSDYSLGWRFTLKNGTRGAVSSVITGRALITMQVWRRKGHVSPRNKRSSSLEHRNCSTVIQTELSLTPATSTVALTCSPVLPLT